MKGKCSSRQPNSKSHQIKLASQIKAKKNYKFRKLTDKLFNNTINTMV